MNAGPQRRMFSLAVLTIAVLATSLTAFATGQALEPPLLPLVQAEPPEPPSVPQAPPPRPAALPKGVPAAPRPIAAAVPSAPAPPRDASVASRPVAAPAPLAVDSVPPAPPAPAAPAPIAVPLPAPAFPPKAAPNPDAAPAPAAPPVAHPAAAPQPRFVAPPEALLKVLRKPDVSFFVAGIPAMNTHARASLLRTIHASFPSARLASSPKNANVFLVFASDRSSQGAGPQSSADAVRPDGVRTTYDNNGRSVSERTFVRQYKAPVALPRRMSVVAFATESPEAAVALYDGLDTPNVVELAIEHLAAMK